MRQIFSGLPLADLVSLLRTAKPIRRMLLTKSISHVIWRRAFAPLWRTGLPKPPKTLALPQYAMILTIASCSVRDGLTTRADMSALRRQARTQLAIGPRLLLRPRALRDLQLARAHPPQQVRALYARIERVGTSPQQHARQRSDTSQSRLGRDTWPDPDPRLPFILKPLVYPGHWNVRCGRCSANRVSGTHSPDPLSDLS